MRVLIVDNNLDPDCWGAADIRRIAARFPGITVYTRRAPHRDLPRTLSSFDRVVISGSKQSCLSEEAWTTELDELVRGALSLGRPILGVCYGHQVLVRVLGGKKLLRGANNPELGWTKIEIVSSSPLFEGLSREFYTFSSHFEEVSELPSGAKQLARSRDCELQAFQLEDRAVYGIQFHPERSLKEAELTFTNWKKEGKTKHLLNAGRGTELFDPNVGEAVFGNFLTL